MKKIMLLGLYLSSFLYLISSEVATLGCCCTDCNCPPGPQGPEGVDGPQGPQGIQGPTGPQGTCVPPTPVFANLYSNVSQSIDPGGFATFEGVNAATSGIDVSLAPITGEIIFNESGWYQIYYDFDAILQNPFPFPVPSWTSSLFINGVLVPGSTQPAFTMSPNAITSHTNGLVIIQVNAGIFFSY